MRQTQHVGLRAPTPRLFGCRTTHANEALRCMSTHPRRPSPYRCLRKCARYELLLSSRQMPHCQALAISAVQGHPCQQCPAEEILTPLIINMLTHGASLSHSAGSACVAQRPACLHTRRGAQWASTERPARLSEARRPARSTLRLLPCGMLWHSMVHPVLLSVPCNQHVSGAA